MVEVHPVLLGTGAAFVFLCVLAILALVAVKQSLDRTVTTLRERLRALEQKLVSAYDEGDPDRLHRLVYIVRRRPAPLNAPRWFVRRPGPGSRPRFRLRVLRGGRGGEPRP